MKELNYDEILEYFKKLNTEPMGDFHKSRIYGMAKAYDDILLLEQPIKDYFADKKWDVLIQVYIVSESIQIAKCENKRNKEIHYHIFLNFKSTNIVEYTFDNALITAICKKYNSEGASMYISKMLGIMNAYENKFYGK